MWNNLDNTDKSEYKKMILAFASLSEMFAQKRGEEQSISSIVPIVNSKYQETVFQRAFHATPEDIGNTSFDASLIRNEVKYLIGIKTFQLNSGAQKIAQFKANEGDWIDLLNEIGSNAQGKKTKHDIDEANRSLYLQLAEKIASIRNMRIDSSIANAQGFSVLNGQDDVCMVYHVLMPSNLHNNPLISVGETSYTKIETDKITVNGCTSKNNPRNFDFEDGNHKYRFTAADSQLLMHFDDANLIKENWKVVYADDAYSIFADIARRVSESVRSEPTVSVSWKLDMSKNQFSGLNSFYGTGSKLSKASRKKRIAKIHEKFSASLSEEVLTVINSKLERYLLHNVNRKEKLNIRKDLMKIVNGCNVLELEEAVSKLIYRPKDEIYIPIPNSKQFHHKHPDFFNHHFGQFLPEDNGDFSVKNIPINNRNFILVLEPSGEEVECFITQDNGKGIQSVNKQSVLGDWLLRKIFQLKDHEHLTDERLNEIGINGIQLYKFDDDKVHLKFVWIEN